MPAGNDLIMGWEKRHVAYLFDLFGNERLIYTPGTVVHAAEL